MDFWWQHQLLSPVPSSSLLVLQSPWWLCLVFSLFPLVCMCFLCTSVSCACVSSLVSSVELSIVNSFSFSHLQTLFTCLSFLTPSSSASRVPPSRQTSSTASTVCWRTITAEMASDYLLVNHCPVNYHYLCIQNQFFRWSAVIIDKTEHCKSSTGNHQRRSSNTRASTTSFPSPPFGIATSWHGELLSL